MDDTSQKILYYGITDTLLPTPTGTIVRNYESIDAESKSKVPDTYYFAVKNLIKGASEHHIAHDLNGKCSLQQKN